MPKNVLLERIKERMPNGNTLDLCNMSGENTKFLNILYEKYKNEYVEMLDELSKGRNTIYWWVTPLVSKYWFLSDSLKNISIAILGIKRIKADCKIRVVYCPSKEIAETIKNYFQPLGRNILVKIKKNDKKATITEQFAEYVQYVNKKIEEYREIRKVLNENKMNILGKRNVTLVDTYIKDSEVDCGSYEEKYFKNILDYTDRKLFFMPQIVVNKRTSTAAVIKKIVRSSRYRYIYKEQFIKIQDYYKLLLYPFFCIVFCLQKKYINDIDVTSIVNRDLFNGIVSSNAVEGMLKFWTIKRMKKQGIKIGRLIGWYEGQPSSNGLFLGYRRAYPKGKSIGYIGYPIDSKNINIAPNKMQANYKAAPQEIAVMAECFEQIPKQFISETKVMIVPALRMQGNYQCDNIKEHSKKSVLIALAYDRTVSSKILKWIKEIEQYFIDNSLSINIKNHPCNAEMTLEKYGIQALKCNYKFVGGSFSEAVGAADFVISTQSTAGYETALYGKPIIFLNFSGELSINYMPKEWDGIRYDVVYGIGELKNVIQKYLNYNIEKLDFDSERYHVLASKDTMERLFR